MEQLQTLWIESTRSTPEVRFDPASRLLAVRGQSYPENAFGFYEPLLKWIGAYLDLLPPGEEAVVELELPYINTTSTKCFMMLFEKLDDAYREGKRVAVRWIYDADNESELECAEEFKEDLSLPFEIVPKEEA